MTTLVQHKVGETSATQATVPITVASTTSGNLMVIGACNSGTLTVSGVADNAVGGTSVYTQVSGAQFNGTANDKGDVWWCPSVKGGVTTITITFSTSDASIKDGWAMEVSGLSSPVIDSAAGAVSGQSNVGVVDNGATVTTTATDGFVFGLVTTSNAISANPQAGNEFSAGGDIQGLTGNAACSLISTTAAAHQPKWTDGASTYGAATVAFKAGILPGTAIGLPTSFHPGQSPGLGGISSARFQTNWWPYSPPAILVFDPAFMSAMEKHGNDPLILPPQVVASGMTPPEAMPT